MSQITDLEHQLIKTYDQFSAQLIEHVPSIMGALVLLVVGWLVASLIQKLAYKLMIIVDQYVVQRFAGVVSNQRSVKQASLKTVSKVLFWLVFLFFFAAASNVLGWVFISEWMNQLFAYVPKATSALLVIFVGIVIANIVRNTLQQSLEGPNRALIIKAVYGIVVFVAAIVAIEQLGINIQFVTTLITVFLALLLAGLVLGFSFGAKDTAANIIAIPYITRQYKVGDSIQIAGVEGVLIDFTQTSVIIENESGKVIIPARMFQVEVSVQQHSSNQE